MRLTRWSARYVTPCEVYYRRHLQSRIILEGKPPETYRHELIDTTRACFQHPRVVTHLAVLFGM